MDTTGAGTAAPGDGRSRLAEVALLFAKLGVIGFGGPAAHIALMRTEVVRRRGWIDDAEFLDHVAAMNLIPGPNSTELAIALGRHRAGRWGLVVAGVCFIVPATLIVAALAWAYERHGTDPAVLDLRYGVLPVIVAVVAAAVVGLGRTVVRSVGAGLLAFGAAVGSAVGVHQVLLLVAAGLLGAGWSARRRLRPPPGPAVLLAAVVAARPGAARRGGAVTADTAGHVVPVSLWRLFVVFAEIGSVLYGSGYVLVALLQRRLVDDLGWLDAGALLDAVTVGQVTPGPVFTTATFIGWQVAGPAGAVVATVGIFLPSFVLVALLGRIVPWVRARPVAAAALDGVGAASLGLMAAVLVELARVSLVDPLTATMAVVSVAVLVRTGLNPSWLVLAGAAIGLLHAVAV
jgi:chromate transporter